MNLPNKPPFSAEINPETDPEINSEINLQTDIETEVETDIEIEQKLTKTASTDSTGTKNDFHIISELDSNNLETDPILPPNNLETDSETTPNYSKKEPLEQASNQAPEEPYFEDSFEDDPIPEINEDPMGNFVHQEPPTNPVDELKKATGDSSKNLKNLADLGEIIFTYVDLAKAQLCSSISGQHVAHYTADEKAKKVLLNAVQEYLNTRAIQAPSPTLTLMMAVTTWAGASLGAAIWHRHQVKQMKQPAAPNPSSTPPMDSPPAEQATDISPQAPDYSHLKEVQDGRKLFSIHKTTGAYKHLADNTYCALDVADEFPSPEIKALLEQHKSNPEIRAILYGE